jgi:hypothetical protein
VSVLCRGRGWRALRTSLAGLCAGAVTAWLAEHLGAGGVMAAAVAATAAVPTLALAWRVTKAAPVTLRWDGQTWQADGQPVQLSLILDLGSALVLRWQHAGAGRPQWTLVAVADAGPAWHGLRTALHARPAGTADKPAPW